MKRRKPSKPAENDSAPSRWPIALALAAIVLATAVAYSNSFGGAFLFDDIPNIVKNKSIRHLWPIRDVFVMEHAGQTTVLGRPVVNLSLAIDYAMGQLEPLVYHVTNLLIHVLAGLALFGIVRRTLLLPGLERRFAASVTPLALAVALIWSLHPLQTESVTYVVQRYESMMGLFFLLALYAAAGCGTSPHPHRWEAVAVLASLLSAGCKEVAISIPLVILLYDRAFLSGSFREALRRRWPMYLGLAATWLVLAGLLAFSPSRVEWAGYGLRISWIEYARSQFGVLLHYLRLSFWPRPLVLDYGWPVAQSAGQIVPAAAVIVGLAAATAWALVRWPKWGFLGACFFLILAPTSSVMPLGELAFEHRMYLPLAAAATGVVLGGYLVGRWMIGRGILSRPASQIAGWCLLTLTAALLAILTFQRNMDYRSDLAMWEDTVAKVPENARAHGNLGKALSDRGNIEDAIVQYTRALELEPDSPTSRNNFGAVLILRGRIEEAIVQIEKALELRPDYPEAHDNLGIALTDCGRIEEAIPHLNAALASDPEWAAAHFNLARALLHGGRIDEAMTEFRNALEIDPNYVEAHNNYGALLNRGGDLDEAIAHYRKALEIRPGHLNARRNLDMAEAHRQEIGKRLAQRREMLLERPDDVALLNETAWMLATDPNASIRNGAEAVDLAQRAAQISENREPAILDTLAAAYAEAGRFPEALETARKAADLAARQDNRPLAESIKGKILLYEAGTPFREKPHPAPPASAQP